MTRPNLFIVGAMKAGTSSLHEYLHQHPQIFMSRMKEPQYFAPHNTRWGQPWGQGNSFPKPGIDWYLKLFSEAGDAKYAGESSVSYTARPWVVDCERRLYEFNPKAKIIYLMRDPIERAISHYWNFVDDGREDRDPLTAIQRKEEYISRSDYAMQIKPYLETFGREQVYTLTLEGLQSDPTREFRELFRWLDVDTEVPIDTRQRFNVSQNIVLQTRRHLVGLDTTLKHWRWKRFERMLPQAIPACLRRLAYRSVDKNAVDCRSTVEYLRPILQERTQALTELLGREFAEWTTLYASTGALAGAGVSPSDSVMSS
jgi:Sulfotransferase domain